MWFKARFWLFSNFWKWLYCVEVRHNIVDSLLIYFGFHFITLIYFWLAQANDEQETEGALWLTRLLSEELCKTHPRSIYVGWILHFANKFLVCLSPLLALQLQALARLPAQCSISALNHDRRWKPRGIKMTLSSNSNIKSTRGKKSPVIKADDLRKSSRFREGSFMVNVCNISSVPLLLIPFSRVLSFFYPVTHPPSAKYKLRR